MLLGHWSGALQSFRLARMAGMDRPQFSLRTMLISVSYLALAFGLFRWAYSIKDYPDWRGVCALWLYLASFASLGAGIEAMFRRQFAGAILTVLVIAYLSYALAALLL